MLIVPVNVTDFDDVNEGDGGLVVLPGSRVFLCCVAGHRTVVHCIIHISCSLNSCPAFVVFGRTVG